MALNRLMTCLLITTVLVTGTSEVVRAADRPNTLASLLSAARSAEVEGRDDRAAALYRHAHEAFPLTIEPLIGWGQLANRIGAHDEAVVLLQSALSMRQHDRDARRHLGEALVNLDRGDEALAVYERLLVEDPTQASDWNGKGLALELIDRRQEARVAYRAGLALSPHDPQLLSNLELSLASESAPTRTDHSNGIALASIAGNPTPAAQTLSAAVPRSVGRDP
ncbi:hypothetical protein BAL199_25987 [alpha proteobacterium BAL199]|jgi:Flp pilus assembly protein TadD|nr:hypothetical protein BAL199_25987 [alpha proteobacterium BAL199]